MIRVFLFMIKNQQQKLDIIFCLFIVKVFTYVSIIYMYIKKTWQQSISCMIGTFCVSMANICWWYTGPPHLWSLIILVVNYMAIQHLCNICGHLKYQVYTPVEWILTIKHSCNLLALRCEISCIRMIRWLHSPK